MSFQSKNPITIEDLLSIKKAEKASPAFWSAFDRSFKKAQGQAVIKPLRQRFKLKLKDYLTDSVYAFCLGGASVTLGVFSFTFLSPSTNETAHKHPIRICSSEAHFVENQLPLDTQTACRNALCNATQMDTAYAFNQLEISLHNNQAGLDRSYFTF